LTNFALQTANTIQKFKIHLFDPPARQATLGFPRFSDSSGDKNRGILIKSASWLSGFELSAFSCQPSANRTAPRAARY
jgi:hypothetical protein